MVTNRGAIFIPLSLFQFSPDCDRTYHISFHICSKYGYIHDHIDDFLNLLQLSTGAHLKLPSYFGAIAVVVCFISALISLAFAFLVIPRQVMPWTGLLLMFEWTFVTFFLLFGSYLRFVYKWGSFSANHAGYGSLDSSENHTGTGTLASRNFVSTYSFLFKLS